MAKTQKKTTFGTFFLPGPTEVRPEVLAAMTQPMIGHRVSEMEDLIGHIQPKLRSIFRTSRPVYISASSATGLMEGAVRNGARRRVLSLVNGAFSERFADIGAAAGLEVETLDVGWGGVHTPDRVADALAQGRFDAVVVVHSETSTGVLNPVAELARVGRVATAAHEPGSVDRHPILVVRRPFPLSEPVRDPHCRFAHSPSGPLP